MGPYQVLQFPSLTPIFITPAVKSCSLEHTYAPQRQQASTYLSTDEPMPAWTSGAAANVYNEGANDDSGYSTARKTRISKTRRDGLRRTG